MLTKERYEEILKIVNSSGSVTNQDLVSVLGVSESTIRRDITLLAKKQQLIRVHGGALSLKHNLNSQDYEVEKRRTISSNQKQRIGSCGASLIEDGDLVYVDAGTTTEFLVKSIPPGLDAVFVTNAVSHAILLGKKGYTAYIPSGRLKAVTEAIVGSGTIMSLRMYNFSKGFFGANGISITNGITTPDADEAAIKEYALSRCRERYILADSDKFDRVSSITFASLEDAVVITEDIPDDYKEYDIIKA
ncbi:MAG: DeoR/GlpR family DNA-binding transcription regulator [Clostridiales bacterium]|nr:DeoR/GlpR family DNA-binding transcription regulator [Clostridiales bacterium]